MKVRALLWLISSIVFIPQLAFAASKADAITFTVGGGYLFFSQKRDLHNTAVPAMAALAYNFTEQWALALAANLINADSGDPDKHHVHGFAYIGDVLYRLHPLCSLEPYVMGGLNVMSLKPISSEPVNQGGMNVGLGAQFWKSNHIALSVEARDLYTFSGGKNDILLNGGVNFIWE
ncbi:MAG TPA: outer membrane beta-barrel protein [Gammaproteobacteria bacterium]|nr:outer membrane beta-barrel protein [Gammaproteobacteria bacterium]